MLRSLPSATDDAIDTLYEPNAVFSQFLGSASMTFFFNFPFLAFSCCLVVFLAFLSFRLFPFLFRFFAFLYILFLFFLFFTVLFPNTLALVVRMRSDMYYVQYYKIEIRSSCEIDDFVATHFCKLCVILRSRVLRVVCPRKDIGR